VKRCFADKGVDFEILPADFECKDGRLNVPEFRNMYTLTKRYSAGALCKKLAVEVSKCQEEYNRKLGAAFLEFTQNVSLAVRMDRTLGVSVTVESPPDYVDTTSSLSSGSDGTADTSAEVDCGRQKLADGTYRVDCPILGCPTSTYKIRRHLSDKHESLNSEQIEFAAKVARRIDKNKETYSKTSPATPCTVQHKEAKKETYRNTQLVNRKNNYKQCLLCQKLVKNLSQHVSLTHKIKSSDPDYDHYVCDPEVIPACYIKMVGGSAVVLSGDELEEAKRKNSGRVAEQKQTLHSLTTLRASISDAKARVDGISDTSGKEYADAKEELQRASDAYKSERYKDVRSYSTAMAAWRDGFLKHLQLREYCDPVRGVRMALDILLSYETDAGETLEFDDLMDVAKIRKILNIFKSQTNTNATTKLKYLTMFDIFIKYLFTDVESPQCVLDNLEQSIFRERKVKAVKEEIEFACKSLSKLRGVDMIRTKTKAERKIVDGNELKELQEEIHAYLEQIFKDTAGKNLDSYTKKQVIEIRNNLMAIGTIRIGKRSKEIIKMTIDEMKDASQREVGDKVFYIVKVYDQKSLKNGKPAAVSFEETEYKLLKLYTEKLRPKITPPDADCKYVFSTSRNSLGCCDMSLSGAYHVLQSFRTKSGKRISSRSVRGSKVTTNRAGDSTDAEKRDMAKAMGHDEATANRYYDYWDLDDSVVKVLEKENKTVLSTSTPVKASTSAGCSSSPSVSRKRTVEELETSYSDSSCSEPSNITIRNLRSRKVIK